MELGYEEMKIFLLLKLIQNEIYIFIIIFVIKIT